MERRSTRGRTSSLYQDTSMNAPVAAVVEVATGVHVPAPNVPDIAEEEIVLNRRGMPVRHRKRNRFYFDDDNMITTDTSYKRNASRSSGKKVKPEPQEEEEAGVITSDLADYGFGYEVEIVESPPREQINPSQAKSSGRGKSSSKAAKAAEPTTRKGKSRRDKERERQQRKQEREAVASILPPKPTQKSQAESAPKSSRRSGSSKKTARLRRPQNGLFTGTVEGVDTPNNTYRITFDKGGLGTHCIPDYEVLSYDPVDTMSISSCALKALRISLELGTQLHLNFKIPD